MVFQVKFDWEIKNFEGFSETDKFQISSPSFFASPDKICHRWQMVLGWTPEHPEFYLIALHLKDAKILQPIYIKLNFKVYNKENEIIAEGRASAPIKKQNAKKAINESMYIRHFIVRSKCHFKSIKKISFEIELSREKLNSSEINHQSTEKLCEDLQRLYESEDFSDITIKCRDREFKAHKPILICRSSVFKTMLENNMKESISKTIQLDDIDPEALVVFLKFLYTGTIKIPPAMIDDILDFSEKYDLKDLKNICELEMDNNIDVSTAVKFLISADKYGMSVVKKKALTLIKDNIKEVIKTEEWDTFMTKDLTNEIFSTFA